MRFWIAVLMFVALFLGAAQAQAGSCSSFVVIKSYDADANTISFRSQAEDSPSSPSEFGVVESKTRRKKPTVQSWGGRAASCYSCLIPPRCSTA